MSVSKPHSELPDMAGVLREWIKEPLADRVMAVLEDPSLLDALCERLASLEEQLEAKDEIIGAVTRRADTAEEQLEIEKKRADLAVRAAERELRKYNSTQEQLETQQAALSEFLSHPVDNKAIERLRAAVSIPASEPLRVTQAELNAHKAEKDAAYNQDKSSA